MAECRRIRVEAEQEALRRQRRGHERAQAVEAKARRQAESVRADAAAEAARRAAHETDAVMARARDELEAIDARVEARMQQYVDVGGRRGPSGSGGGGGPQMSTAWVAGSVRAVSLSSRRLGAAGARALAGQPGLPAAVETLVATPYGHDVRTGESLAEVQHAVGATLIWHLRVLAGWQPREGADTVRRLAAGLEILNVDGLLARVRGVEAKGRSSSSAPSRPHGPGWQRRGRQRSCARC